MARPLRLELAGGLYHVTAQGDGREDLYLSDTDRLAWLEIFAQVCQRFNWVGHAWCQMDNHYHLLIKTPEANLSQGMRQLNGVYTQYFNRSNARVGHVYQGRYKAIALAYLSGQHTMAKIAEHFDVHYTMVSRVVSLYEKSQAE